MTIKRGVILDVAEDGDFIRLKIIDFDGWYSHLWFGKERIKVLEESVHCDLEYMPRTVVDMYWPKNRNTYPAECIKSIYWDNYWIRNDNEKYRKMKNNG